MFISVGAESIRMAMLVDKAGGSLTRLGFISSKVASAAALGNLTPQGRFFQDSAKLFQDQNKLWR